MIIFRCNNTFRLPVDIEDLLLDVLLCADLRGSCLNNNMVLLYYPWVGSVSAKSWFVESPWGSSHRHRATHTMTQCRLCGLGQGPPAMGGGHKTWLMSLSLSLPFFCSLSICLSIAISSPSLLRSAHLSLYPLPSNEPVCLSPHHLLRSTQQTFFLSPKFHP